MKLQYTERARQDVELAFGWYEEERRGLGFEFLDCLESGIIHISHNPETYPFCHPPFRRFLIRRFPFSVYSTIEREALIVHSVFDNRQDPDKRP